MNDKKKRLLWSGILIAFILFIFGNSLAPADESSSQSGNVLLLVRQIFAMLGLGGIEITEHFIRKSAHFTEYFVLGTLLLQNLRLYREAFRQYGFLGLWIGLVIPLLDETLQLFTIGRSGQISDVWLDYSGVLCGLLFWGWLHATTGKMKRRKQLGKTKL